MLATQTGGAISFQQDQIQITGEIDTTKRLNFDCDTNIPPNTTITLQIPASSGELLTTESSITASALKTTGSAVIISNSSPPTTGQILKANSSTDASWQDPPSVPPGTGVVVVNNGVGSALSYIFSQGDTLVVGTNSLSVDTPVSGNTVLGNGVMPNNTTGGKNVAVGFNSMNSYVGPDGGNIAIGPYAMSNVINSKENIAIGAFCMPQVTTGTHNIAIGAYAATNLTIGDNNCMMGKNSMYTNTAGSNNVCFGANSGYSAVNLNNSVLIGSNTDVTQPNLTNVTCIGYGTTCGLSNTCVIGNSTQNMLIRANVGSLPPGMIHPDSILTIDSYLQGLGLPSMSTIQKLAIVLPTAGLMVYDNTLNQVSYYNDTTWVNI
jgi:hypothetical protein